VCRFSHLPDGFRHRDLRPLVAGLLGRDLAAYTAGAMTYDLRRLRLHGIIARIDRTQRYTLTATGVRAAFFYATLHRRLCQVRPPSHAEDLPAPTPLSAALRQLDTAVAHFWRISDHAA
jgi:hypothetical protein